MKYMNHTQPSTRVFTCTRVMYMRIFLYTIYPHAYAHAHAHAYAHAHAHAHSYMSYVNCHMQYCTLSLSCH